MLGLIVFNGLESNFIGKVTPLANFEAIFLLAFRN